MVEDKAIKAFIEASQNRLFNPYYFANGIKTAAIPGDPMTWNHGTTIAAMQLHKVAIGWFLLNEIDYSYGIGDPIIGEMADRIKHEVLNDYEELPEYQPFRGFENTGGDATRTWESNQSKFPPSFIRRGATP